MISPQSNSATDKPGRHTHTQRGNFGSQQNIWKRRSWWKKMQGGTITVLCVVSVCLPVVNINTAMCLVPRGKHWFIVTHLRIRGTLRRNTDYIPVWHWKTDRFLKPGPYCQPVTVSKEASALDSYLSAVGLCWISSRDNKLPFTTLQFAVWASHQLLSSVFCQVQVKLWQTCFCVPLVFLGTSAAWPLCLLAG